MHSTEKVTKPSVLTKKKSNKANPTPFYGTIQPLVPSVNQPAGQALPPQKDTAAAAFTTRALFNGLLLCCLATCLFMLAFFFVHSPVFFVLFPPFPPSPVTVTTAGRLTCAFQVALFALSLDSYAILAVRASR